MFEDGNGATYDSGTAQFTSTPFGKTLPDGKSLVTDLLTTTYYKPFDFGTATVFAQKVDNSVAGEMRDCGECHVGGGMMEYMIDPAKTVAPAYDATKRTSLRDYVFGGAVTAFNALIDIFNTTPANKGNVVTQDYAQTGVLEMDCLICHQNDYSWEHRRDMVREGKYDASRAMGAKLAVSAVDGVNVIYDPASVSTDTNGKLVANLEYKIVAKPTSNQCASCHLANQNEKYQVDWKKRGEMWTTATGTILDVHGAIGCMGCHERTGDKAGATALVGVSGNIGDAKLGLCDPAKGGASPFDAMWNKMDKVEFKDCAGCHEYTTAPSFATFGAPNSKGAHDRAGLTAEIAYDKNGNKISHIGLIDCTACHIRKDGFSGGAFVDGTGADEEGRLAVHDTEYVAKGDMANGVAVHWQNGKMYAANLLTSFFWRDMNGLKGPNGGLDVNNDGRPAGMDPLLQTHVNNINIASGLHALTADGIVTAAEISTQKAALAAGIRGQLGITGTTQSTNAFLPKLSFLMVPFKASHNIASADRAWGKNGCKECHAANAGFYNGSYPINGNMDGKFSFDSDQVTTFTKVNGLVDVTDSHPNVVTKDGTRSLPIPILTKFDNAYTQTMTPGQTLRNIDRSEVLYEANFQTVKQDWVPSIQGGGIAPACNSASPFYCEDPAYIWNAAKKGATSTLGWTLKVDVKTGVDTEGKDVVVPRTVQVMNDKVTSVTALVTALGSVGGSYFTVEGVITDAGTVPNALKLTALGANQIRINKASDVGPFGLKGALWKSAPIVRGTNSYATRADYVTYLNSIDAAAFGVGQAPVAAIAAVGQEAATVVPMTVGTAQTFKLNGSAANGAAYQWATNAAGATIATATDSQTAITFTKAGTYRVALTVTNVDGATASSYKLVNVTNPVYISAAPATTTTTTVVPATSTKAGYTYTTVTTKVPVTLAAGTPTYDKVRFFWGDGSTSTTLAAADFATANGNGGVAHVYNRYSKYFKSATSKYTYKTTIQLFNGSTLVSSQSVIVEVP